MTPLQLVYGRTGTTSLASMVPIHEPEEDIDVDDFMRSAEEARELARQRIQHQQLADASRYNKHRRAVFYGPGDALWAWVPVRQRGRSEKLLRRNYGPYKIVRRLSDVNYEVTPDSRVHFSRRRPISEVVHVVRMKPYYDRG